MTTIAYCAVTRTMAADTQATSGTRKLRCVKVHRLACGGLIGGSGHWSNIQKAMRWAEAGFAEGAKPVLTHADDGGGFECLVVRGDGTVYTLDDDLELLPFTDGIFSVGSGGDYALAAMACGKTPAEAVKIAARFDAATSEPIESWTLEPPKAKAKIRGRAKAK